MFDPDDFILLAPELPHNVPFRGPEELGKSFIPVPTELLELVRGGDDDMLADLPVADNAPPGDIC